jgi:transposase
MAIGFVVGGEPGSRLSGRLAMPVSGDTLLRMIRVASFEPAEPLRVVGIDDWAWRKGERYGTIICDLERNRVLDLLPDRNADTVASWLEGYPGIEIIARDRAGCYADGARRGAPQARQVADRWHLLHNLSDTLIKLADHQRLAIRASARMVVEGSEPQADAVTAVDLPVRQTAKGKAREERYREIRRLRDQGLQINEIARLVGLGHLAVSRWLKAKGPPAHAKPPRIKMIDPFEPLLEQRWDEGMRSAASLWGVIREAGFTGTERTVRRRVRAKWGDRSARRQAHAATAWPPPTSRQCIRLLMASHETLTDQERTFVEALKGRAPSLIMATQLALTFSNLMRNRDPAGFDAWLDEAGESELASFTAGLLRDRQAVRAAFEEDWSTSPVEGQINRLKTIKRQMYGRAGYPLLRSRVLTAA